MPVQETRARFNQLRWSGQGKKVVGINPNAGNAVILDPAFAAVNRPVIVQGDELHEKVHQNDDNNLDSLYAIFSYTFEGGERWLALG